MKLVVVTHVKHSYSQGKYWGYGPYIREMNIWLQYVKKVTIVAPLVDTQPNQMDCAYTKSNIQFIRVPEFSLINLKEIVFSLLVVPYILIVIINQFRKAQHLHLRCPGNMGLLGTIAQIFFPSKPKSVKYAGNWDSYHGQPYTYKLQKKILQHTLLSRNIKVLVYGHQGVQNRNIYPFFTASFSYSDKTEYTKPAVSKTVNLAFLGSLTNNKRPLLCLKITRELHRRGIPVYLHMIGQGPNSESLMRYAEANEMIFYTSFTGAIKMDKVKYLLQKSHFVFMLSQSEGWSKAVAESMYWGCIPIATPVGVVPEMIGNNERGYLINPFVTEGVEAIISYLEDPKTMKLTSERAKKWSRKYNLERMDTEIRKIVTSHD